ncbi:MAG: sulfotransferase [Nonlabens sp.]
MIFSNKKPKVFCIGFNKTGTTTIKYTLEEHNYKMNVQSKASVFLKDWKTRNFKPLIKYCEKYEAFQDFPFSFPYTYIALDLAFPNSKFILTVRDTPEVWYKSITTFHGKLWANGKTPSKEDLMNAVRHYKGRPWEVNRSIFKTPESDPYNEEILKEQYVDHIKSVKEYFRFRPDDFLVINVSKNDDYRKMCDFLKVKPKFEKFPWKNKT